MTAAVDISVRGDGWFNIRVVGDAPDVTAVASVLSPIAGRTSIETPSTYIVSPSRLTVAYASLARLAGTIAIQLARDGASDQVLVAFRGDLARLRTAMTDSGARADVVTPANFVRELTEHQSNNLARLAVLPHGADFSVPGAGKTTVALALHAWLKSLGLVDKLLVVCPRNAFAPWEEETALCFSVSPSIERVTGGMYRVRANLRRVPGPDIRLITYSQFAYSKADLEEFFLDNPRTHLILDESHRIKRGSGGFWASAIKAMAPLAARRDILSGTPMPNSIADLSNQLEFLWPYQRIIPDAVIASGSARLVSRHVRPVYVRTTKEQLGLPVPIVAKTNVVLGRYQAEIYGLVSSATAQSMRSVTASDRLALGRMKRNSIRLLQLASNPGLLFAPDEAPLLPPLSPAATADLGELLRNYRDYEVAPKILAAVDRVKERARRGKKTIVWSCFVSNLRTIADLLNDLDPVVIHGGIPTVLDAAEIEEGSREQLIAKFKGDPQCFALVANPAACGESISLHKECDYAVYVDRNFNAAQLVQSMDRIHRLGMDPEKPPTFEFLLAADTIDAVVDHRLALKVTELAQALDDVDLERIWLDVDESEPETDFDADDAQSVLDYLIAQRT